MFGTLDFLIYILLNRYIEKGKLIIYGSIVFIFCLVHLNAFHIRFLLSQEKFFDVLSSSLILVILHIAGKIIISKISKPEGMDKRLFDIAIKAFSFLTFRFIYIIVFITQCLLLYQAKIS